MTWPLTLTHGGGEDTPNMIVIASESPTATFSGCLRTSVVPSATDLRLKPAGIPLDVMRYCPGGNWAVKAAAAVTLMGAAFGAGPSILAKASPLLNVTLPANVKAAIHAIPPEALQSSFGTGAQ